MNPRMWVFGILGAGLGAFGDYIILAAYKDKTHVAFKLTIGVLSWMLCAPTWYYLVQETDGRYTEGAIAWTVTGTVLGVLIALVLREKQTPWGWVGFLLIGLGAVIRAFAKSKD